MTAPELLKVASTVASREKPRVLLTLQLPPELPIV
jgi:hypothetical protein